MTILETQGLTKIYGSGETAVHALRGVDLTVENGEFVAIVGTSGSGKSTLLHMLGGLDRPTAGKVLVDGQDIFAFKDEALTIFRRRRVGFVFQSYNLVPMLSVYENIVLPIARALATKPAIVLADEPTGNLDSKTSQDVLGLMKVTSQRFGQTMVMITHNEEIAQLADRVVRVEDGRVVTR